MRTTISLDGLQPPVFVFGSNLAGRHGKGAALHARREHGAVRGVGVARGWMTLSAQKPMPLPERVA